MPKITNSNQFNLNNILLCIIHKRIRQQAISLYKPSPTNSNQWSGLSPIGNTNQRMGVHGILNISEVGSGAMEE
jgi:hypothetical protein